jgi:UDP-3-O-[3-hydroxymyristoyl] N-acetylglucosamine deacetylase
MKSSQTTLRSPVSIEGIALHTGHHVRATFRPAPEDHGIVFRREDHPGVALPALPESALGFDHATTLGIGAVQVGTAEHALSAARGLGIDNLDIEVRGDELIPDRRLGDAFRPPLPGRRRREAAAAAPADQDRAPARDPARRQVDHRPSRRGLTITYEIDFPHRAIGHQSLTIEIVPEAYASRIAPARTVGFRHEIHYLRERGLARGGSLQNAIVLDEKNILSGPLRFADEFVRHKILDLVGDLFLLGRPLRAHVVGRNAGHALNYQLVTAIQKALAADRRRVAAPTAPLLCRLIPLAHRSVLDPMMRVKIPVHRFATRAAARSRLPWLWPRLWRRSPTSPRSPSESAATTSS